MRRLPIPKSKPAAATIRGGLNLVSTTNLLTKEQMNVFYHIPRAAFKPS